MKMRRKKFCLYLGVLIFLWMTTTAGYAQEQPIDDTGNQEATLVITRPSKESFRNTLYETLPKTNEKQSRYIQKVGLMLFSLGIASMCYRGWRGRKYEN